MTKTKSTKRALLMSALSMLLCVSMLVGSTFAWFTDSVTSGKNQIVAGNLDVELDYKKVVDGVATEWDTVKDKTAIFDPNALWEPGHVEVVYLRVTNKGSLELKYQLGVNFKDITIGKTEDGKEIKLSDHLVFATVASDTETIYANRDEVVKAAAGTEKGLKDYNGTTNALEVGGVDYLTLIVYMPETVGNEANYRGNDIPTIELGINLYATQYTAEEDSFDEFYDKNAWVDGMKVYNAADLVSALANEDKVILVNDIATTDVIELKKDVSINLNGKTLSASLDVSDDVEISIENGKIVNGNMDVSGIQVNKGNVTLTDVEITSARHAVRVEGGEVVINDGIYKVSGSGKTQHAVNVSDGGKVTINGGTFTGPKGVVADSGAAVMVQEGSTVIINGGNFSDGKNNTLSTKETATLTVTGGTFDQNPSAYVADGFKAVDNGNGTFTVLPNVGTDLTAVAGHPGVYKANGEHYYVASADALVDVFATIIPQNVERAQSVSLLADIDLSGKIWEPLNNQHVTINGMSHTIRNLTAGMAADGRRSGFFGYAGGVTINDLTLENVDVTGSQVGAFAGAGEGLKINNCFLKGDNKVTYIDGIEDWNGIGAITGVLTGSAVNVEIVDGATVTLNKAGFVTDSGCTFFDNLTGYLNANAGTVVNNGQIIVGVSTADELTAAVSNAADGDTIKLLNDITGTAVALQKKNVDVVIDGNGNKFDGTIRINGARQLHNTETLIIQNVKFVADAKCDFIDCNEVTTNFGYAHNVTIKKCSFTGTGNEDVVALRLRQTRNITVEDCTATGLHSLLWSAGTDGVNVIDVAVENCKNGVSVEGTTKVTLKDSTIETTGAEGYGIRVQANAESTTKISGCTFEAAVPVLLRKASGTYALAIEGENTFTATNTAGYQIIITDSDFGAGKTLIAPSGNATVTGIESFVVYNG